jgi:hypothetical protein
LAKAKEAQKDADRSFLQLEAEAKAANKPDLGTRFQEARVKLAKIGLVERSINKGTGDVDAAVMGRAYDAGEKLTGNFEKIGRFQNAFSQMVKDASLSPPAGVNQLLPILAGTGAMYAGARSGSPAIGAGVIAAYLGGPEAARRTMLSGPYQNNFVNYSYGATRQDAPAMLAQFAGKTVGRDATRPVPYKSVTDTATIRAEREQAAKDQELAKKAEADAAKAKAEADAKAADEKARREEEEKKPEKSAYQEGKVYRDPETGERRRYRKGQFVEIT